MIYPAILILLLNQSSPTTDPVPQVVGDLLQSSCVECHSGEEPKGGLDLEVVLEDGATAPMEDWRLVHRVLTSGEMPPEDEPSPTSQERDAAILQLQDWMRQVLQSMPETPGAAVTRRLSRTELHNTIRDLTGFEMDIERHLPADPSSDGFDNQGGSLSPTYIERLFRIAEEVAQGTVIISDDDSDLSTLHEVSEFKLEGGGRVQAGSAYFWSRGSVSVPHFFPRSGTYRIHVEGWGQQAGNQHVRFGLQVGKNRLDTIEFSETREKPGRRSLERHFSSGTHQIRATFINDYYKPEHPDPTQRDRNAAIVSIRVDGPAEGLEPTHFQQVALDGDGTPRERLARGARQWLPLFWRKPVSQAMRQKLVDTAVAAASDPTSAESLLRSALVAAIVSPRFILRIESTPSDVDSGTIRNLQGHELATRLSYFLWGTTPDQSLMDAAEQGSLDQPEGLLAATRRLLLDPRSRSLGSDFATQWLRIRDLGDHLPDRKIFPDIDRRLLGYMKAETIELFDHVLRNRLPLSELIDTPYIFANNRLARHYGLKEVKGDQIRRIEVENPRGGGLMSQASILLATSTRQRSSPVLRGKWLLEVLLDAAPPPPPPGAGTLPLPGEVGSELPLREQLRLHRSEPACSICHRRMDALGFSLERFDAVGRYRTGEIDTRGELPDGSVLLGIEDLRNTVSSSDGFARSLAKNMLIYALGRGLTERDEPSIARLMNRLETDPSIPALIEEIVLLKSFRSCMVP
ncbi:MAG: DUF1592 domain-containing protein [Planctomycetota bacterium]|nr:DUF1592 domain-containing protein [Planctomycetota bacterium]